MQRKCKNWCRDAAPLGAVDTRTRRGHKVRMIKVRMDGLRKHRWMHLARWRWERDHGPVPDGMIVAHWDGDTLNDDPENYRLVTRGEYLQRLRTLRPKMREKCETRRLTAIRAHNSLRAQIRLGRGELLPSRWYPVDLDRGVIILAPRRQRWQVAAEWLGVAAEPDRNGRGVLRALRNSKWRIIRGRDLSADEFTGLKRVLPDAI